MKLDFKKFTIALSVCALSLLSPFTSFAAQWKQDNVGWWYDYGNGSYAKSKWENINGVWYLFNDSGYRRTGWVQDNGKWYYLNGNGAMFSDAITPDGFAVNSNGEWISQTISISEVTVAINDHWDDYAAEYFRYLKSDEFKKFNANYEIIDKMVNPDPIKNKYGDLTIISIREDNLCEMQDAINNLRNTDFSKYNNSNNKLIKYHSTIAETLRISMIYYGTLYIDERESINYNLISIISNSVVISRPNSERAFDDLVMSIINAKDSFLEFENAFK